MKKSKRFLKMKKSKEFLKSLFEFVATPQNQGTICGKFKLLAKERDWALEQLQDCVESFHDPETGATFTRQKPGSHFSCPWSVVLPKPFLDRLANELRDKPGLNIRNLYQKRYSRGLIEAAIEDGFIIEVKDSYQNTPLQRRLFWAETHSALAKGTQVEVDEKAQQLRREAEEMKRYNRSLKYVEDIDRFTFFYARRRFPHLVRYHREEVEQVVLLAKELLRGSCVKVRLLSAILDTRFYHDSKELGYRRVNNKWIKEYSLEEKDEFSRAQMGRNHR